MRKFLLLWVVGAGWVSAAPPSFSREVQPILNARCVMCHSEQNPSNGIALGKYESVLSLVTPKDPEASSLISAVSGEKPDMPKVGPKLTAKEVEILRQWIAAGALNDSKAGAEGGKWWSQRPLEKVKPPAAGHPIDAFVQAKLAEKKLSASAEADRRTLIRRLSYDLHGLPPTPEEVRAFVEDRSPQAYERLVDRLLDSPRYGERWARHWLDVVHYGDSHGYDKDKPRPNAWRYRDWVIEAFNTDKAYKRFIEEQIAGDVLAPEDPKAISATGFLAAGPWDFVGHQELREGTIDKNLTRVLDRDDMVATTIATFTSQTAHCARCHDHKFDPISQADYYSLQAVFAGVDRAERPLDADPAVAKTRRALLEKKRQLLRRLQPLRDKADFASTPELDRLEFQIRDASFLLVHLGEPKTPAEAAEKERLTERRKVDTAQRKKLLDEYLGAETLQETARLEEELKALDAEVKALPAPQYVYAAANYFDRMGNFRPALDPRAVHVLARGSVEAPQAVAPPGAIGGVRFAIEDAAGEGARRLALARWISDDGNAFTWRSIVNRVWQYHFGVGLVDSPSDFGRMGSEPTHPELLDWLAVWFRDEAQGSLKKLHRLMVSSHAYRQVSTQREDAAKVDADNRYLWRMNRTRLDAEAVRDTMLALSGKMNWQMGGPAARQFFFKDDHSPVYDYARVDPQDPALYRRSIYRFIVRSVPDPFMDRLDCPDASIQTPKRNTTLTAVQALTLLNNPFVLRMAQEFAQRWSKEDPVGDAYRLALGRAANPEEKRVLEAHLAAHGAASAARLLFNTNEFVFVD